jgi:hypothetical protein
MWHKHVLLFTMIEVAVQECHCERVDFSETHKYRFELCCCLPKMWWQSKSATVRGSIFQKCISIVLNSKAKFLSEILLLSNESQVML